MLVFPPPKLQDRGALLENALRKDVRGSVERSRGDGEFIETCYQTCATQTTLINHE